MEKVATTDNIKVSYFNQANSELKKQNYDEAISLFLKEFDLRKEKEGELSQPVLEILSVLAYIYQVTHRTDQEISTYY